MANRADFGWLDNIYSEGAKNILLLVRRGKYSICSLVEEAYESGVSEANRDKIDDFKERAKKYIIKDREGLSMGMMVLAFSELLLASVSRYGDYSASDYIMYPLGAGAATYGACKAAATSFDKIHGRKDKGRNRN